MAILATALRGTGVDWSATLMIARARGDDRRRDGPAAERRARAAGLKVKLAKHLFEHRYDYRTEWLRFTDTLGRAGPDAPPLGERIVKAFADIVDAPGGLLLVNDGGRALAVAASWNWPGRNPAADALHDAATSGARVEASGRILELEALRDGWASAEDKVAAGARSAMLARSRSAGPAFR